MLQNRSQYKESLNLFLWWIISHYLFSPDKYNLIHNIRWTKINHGKYVYWYKKKVLYLLAKKNVDEAEKDFEERENISLLFPENQIVVFIEDCLFFHADINIILNFILWNDMI